MPSPERWRSPTTPAATARADAARALVRDRFGIGTMAAALAGVYQRVPRLGTPRQRGGSPVRLGARQDVAS